MLFCQEFVVVIYALFCGETIEPKNVPVEKNGQLSCIYLIKIKNPLGFLQSNHQILAEWVELIMFIKNMFLWNTLGNPQSQDYNNGTLPLLLNILRFISCMMIYRAITVHFNFTLMRQPPPLLFPPINYKARSDPWFFPKPEVEITLNQLQSRK